jgi:phage host-nuclease inhibitor protein Gam
MAQIRSKQIADFLSSVNWASVNSTDIANAADIKALVSTEIAAVNGDNSAVSDALVAEISATNSDFVRVEAHLSAEIYDARLYTSDEMSRATEAEGFINNSIDSLEVALSGEIADMTTYVDGEVTSIDARILVEEGRVDAILAAADADKDTFVEIVSLINAVDLTNDDALAAVILDLNAEISATNSDFVRVEANLSAEIAATNTDVEGLNASVDSLETALTAEISATNADFVSVEGKLSAETSRAEAAELVLTNDLATLSTEVVDEVASIDARLGDVSGNLVDSVDSLETALTAEISATNADFTSIEGIISDEKGRIDAILLASAADKDSFAEIVSLINLVDTTNDDAFAAYALNTDASIDSLETALTAEISSMTTYVDGEVSSLETALSVEISATNSDFVRAEANLSTEIADMTTYVNGEVTTLNGTIDSLETAHDSRLTSLEGYIMEDAEMAVESFTGAGFEYHLTRNVQDDNKFLVSAFVNGHKVEVESVNGPNVTLVNPHYDIDADDKVVITYQY